MPEALPALRPAAPPPAGKRPLLMGILNATPDSFYAGSRAVGSAGLDLALRLLAEGADILDVGGESTRPGSKRVSIEDEKRRVLPLIEQIAKKTELPISVDTQKPEVALAALDAGATILNDVNGLRADGMCEAAVRFDTVIIMHMLGDSPQTMQTDPHYDDVVCDITNFFIDRLTEFKAAGGDAGKIWLDPGLGFGKTRVHNETILSHLEDLRILGRPLVIGASRKSFIGKIHGTDAVPVSENLRLEGSLAAACRAAQAGAAVLRVHDVAPTRRALEVWMRIAR